MIAALYSLVITDLLALPSVQRSLIALIIGGIAMPIVGVFIIGLDVITVRFAVMHMALFGTALGMWIGIEPTLVALVACVLTAIMVAPAADKPGGLAGPMSFLMTISAAAALLVLSISGVNANGAFEILWGSILAVRKQDLLLIIVVSVLVLALVALKRRELALLLFDRELAKCSGIAIGFLTMSILAVIALSIGSAIRVTGALLVDSITLLPALGARNLASSMGSMMKWASGLGVVGNVIGFFIALQLDLPPGPVLVLVAGAFTLGAGFVKRGTRTRAMAIH
jgi:zinc transport system permease protein